MCIKDIGLANLHTVKAKIAYICLHLQAYIVGYFGLEEKMLGITFI